MKLKNLLACTVTGMLLCTSCIKDEAPNVEAAIDACYGENVQLANIDAENKKIDVYVPKSASFNALQLIFTLPDGASIKADSKLSTDIPPFYDFSKQSTRAFTVTSEDGVWKTTYQIGIIITELPTSFHFESLLENSNAPYDVFYENQRVDTETKILQWTSGNPGYKLTGMSNSREDYPTIQFNNGHLGKCAKLTTMSTGSFGEMVKMYIAAGNLFIGSFDLTNALVNAPKATKFGFPFYQYPERLTGYYKYKAGSVYTEKGQPVENKKDLCDIYAIMYETDESTDFLDGETALTSPNLVLLARIDPNDIVESDKWNKFNLPFKKMNDKEIDSTKLKEGKYKLAIVFSSSVGGASFNGAIGSTLYIDEVELICKTDN